MIAEALLRHGATVCIVGRREQLCDSVSAELSVHGPCEWICADLSAPDSVSGIVAEFSRRHSSLHVLVNNAGITRSGPVESYSMKDWDEVFAVNVRAPFELSSRLVPLLEASASRQDPSRIIMVGSVSGNLVTNDNKAFAYGPSKAAAHHLTRGLAVELASRNVLVNAIAPGAFPSNMTDFSVGDQHLFDLAAAAAPLKRIGNIDDIGGMVVFLAGRMSTFLTGAVLPLDGGWSVKGLTQG